MEDFGFLSLRRLIEARGDALEATHAQWGDATAIVSAGQVADILRFLRDDADCDFDMLMDLCAVDHFGPELGDAPRFEVVYHLYSLGKNHRLRVKARVPESPCEIATVADVWPSANWMEREVFDLYGVTFTGHPDLRRLLLYEEFEGHPLRKDYPKTKRQPLVGPQN